MGDRKARLEQDSRAYVDEVLGSVLNAEQKERMVQLMVERPSWHFVWWRLARAWKASWLGVYRAAGIDAAAKRLSRWFGAAP